MTSEIGDGDDTVYGYSLGSQEYCVSAKCKSIKFIGIDFSFGGLFHYSWIVFVIITCEIICFFPCYMNKSRWFI